MAKSGTTQAETIDALAKHMEAGVLRLLECEHRLNAIEDRLSRVDGGDDAEQAKAQARRLVSRTLARVNR